MVTGSSAVKMLIPPTPLQVAVDLVPLRPGGENGGIRPFLFELLGWLGRQTDVPLRFTFLTNSRTHDEVRRELARLSDTLVCVREEPGGRAALPPELGTASSPQERWWPTPPADVAAQLGAAVLYCPFGAPDFACPGLPVVCTVVDVLHRDFPPSLPTADRERRENFFQHLAARAERLQCNTEYVRGQMTRYFNVEPERMFHVYNAVHGRFHAAALPAELPAAASPGSAPYFFYPANTWVHKNHEVLLLAYGLYRHAAHARGEAPWDLLLTGHADERLEELRALADTLDLGGGVRFAGYVAPEDFGGLWAGAGALVFPSLHEGFGIPLLEAMHHGVPVACSAECSLPEVGADACLYVTEARQPNAWAAALTRLATDAGLRRDLVARGRRRLQDFSLAREGGRLLGVLRELATGKIPLRPDTAATGLSPDGWTAPEARFPLPAAARGRRCRLEVGFAPMPAARHGIFRCGPAVVGNLAPATGAPGTASWTLWPEASALTLRVPDAAALAPGMDPRTHGVHLRTLRLSPLDADDRPGEGWDLLTPALAAAAAAVA